MKGAIKICGIRTAEAFECAASSGATHAGFMFVDTSPRFITPTEAASFARPRPSLVRVAVTLDATDEELNDIHATFQPDLWQLHGSEAPARLEQVKARFGKPVMKAVTIKGPDSISLAHGFEPVADALLLDAAAGGSGETFDWTLLASQTWSKPWFLAGGLNPETVASAIYQTRPPGVDVSSGVEKSRGNKDCDLIASFISRAKKAFDDIARGQTPTHP
jgi:phosphoribosylanthranilate isomerase